MAFVFGPEDGAVSEKLVFEAAKEANVKSYHHLYVIGFAIQPNARELIEKSGDAMGIAATYVQATPDLVMGDLLKTMRSSQIFSVCGLPDIKIARAPPERKGGEPRYTVELLGLDVFDPATMEVEAGTTSAPFETGEHRRIAVKVIDDRGNELLVVKSLSEARG